MINLSKTQLIDIIYKDLIRASQNTMCAATRETTCEWCAGKWPVFALITTWKDGALREQTAEV